MNSNKAIASITNALHAMGLTPMSVHLGNSPNMLAPFRSWEAPRIEFKGLLYIAKKVLEILQDLFSRSAIQCEWVLEGAFDPKNELYWVMTFRKYPVKCRLWADTAVKQDLRIIGMKLVDMHGMLRAYLTDEVLGQAERIEREPLEWRSHMTN